MKTDQRHRARKRVQALRNQLARLLEVLKAEERRMAPLMRVLHPSHREGARQLRWGVVLRKEWVRRLDARLDKLGFAKLGDKGWALLPRIRTLIDALVASPRDPETTSIAGEPSPDPKDPESGIADKAAAIFGNQRRKHGRHFMVTLSGETADDPSAIRNILAAGADCVRINCARDNQEIWERIIRHVRRAETSLGKTCRILMDLGGPKVRTGPMPALAGALKIRPVRDGAGNVTRPARIALVLRENPRMEPGDFDAVVPVRHGGIRDMRPGMHLSFRDARGAKRRWTVLEIRDGQIIAEAYSTAYLAPGTPLRLKETGPGRRRANERTVWTGEFLSPEAGILLRKGDSLQLAGHPAEGHAAEYDDAGRLLVPARAGTSVSVPVNRIHPGQEIWFDDGKIGGIVRDRRAGMLRVEIRVVRGGRRLLRADRSINIPGVDLGLDGLTEKDREDLRFALRFADMVGLSFVRTVDDVDRLLEAIKSPAGRRMGFIVKIENTRAVEAIDDLLLAAMRHPLVGVLVARGDLAVECGFARLPGIQDEILRRSHMAGLPVIWATEVLENLSQRGVPTRPELTDAQKAMEAECILLGKGPHVAEAIRLLVRMDALRRVPRRSPRSL